MTLGKKKISVMMLTEMVSADGGAGGSPVGAGMWSGCEVQKWGAADGGNV